MKCGTCGYKMDEETPLSAMGYPMHGRGVEEYVCMNPRCPKFGEKA